jgi:hypothetical protein
VTLAAMTSLWWVWPAFLTVGFFVVIKVFSDEIGSLKERIAELEGEDDDE